MPITDEEYKKIRARLREDFIILPKDKVRRWGGAVLAALAFIGIVGFLSARRAGRSAAIGFLESETGKIEKQDLESLQLEAKEALARSREATEAAVDAYGQIELLLDSLKARVTGLEALPGRVDRLEKAQHAAPK